ncbi:MAG: PilZ domain-containing protein [Planctomycetota bacterium]
MDQPAPNHADRRSFERRMIGLPGLCFEVPPDTNTEAPGFACRLVDVSRGGLAIAAPRPMRPDTRVVVVIGRENRSRTFFAQVRHCRVNDEGAHIVGMEFLPHPIDVESLERLREVALHAEL